MPSLVHRKAQLTVQWLPNIYLIIPRTECDWSALIILVADKGQQLASVTLGIVKHAIMALSSPSSPLNAE